MKTSNKILLIGLGLFLVFSVIGLVTFNNQVKASIVQGNGVIKEKVYDNLQSFNNVEIKKFDYELIQSNEDKVIVKIDENLMDRISVKVTEKGTLKIDRIDGIFNSNNNIKVTIYYKEIHGITCKSGKCTAKIVSDKFKATFESGARGDLDINSSVLYAHVTSGANLKLRGSSDSIVVTGGSGASLKAKKFITKKCSVKIGSGTDVEVFATELIEGKVSSGASLEYYGEPKNAQLESSSGGDIDRM